LAPYLLHINIRLLRCRKLRWCREIICLYGGDFHRMDISLTIKVGWRSLYGKLKRFKYFDTEQLLGFRGNCPLRMHIPNKPAKYGMKLVLICDNETKYMLGGMPYLGKHDTTPRSGVNLGHYYTFELTRPYHGSNRNVTTNKWFTYVPLISDLLTNYGMTLVGSVRGNKREIPLKMKPKATWFKCLSPHKRNDSGVVCGKNVEGKKENCASAVIATHPAYRCSKRKARDHGVLQCHQGRGRHLRPNVFCELMLKENTTLASLYLVWYVEGCMHKSVHHSLWESGRKAHGTDQQTGVHTGAGEGAHYSTGTETAGDAYSVPPTAHFDYQCLSGAITGQCCRCTRDIVCWQQVNLVTLGALLWTPCKVGQ